VNALLKHSLSGIVQRWTRLLIFLFFVFLLFFSSLAWLVQAAGSNTLFPAGATGNRANLEWRTSQYANFFLRRSLLKVYANAGEYILMGSSAISVTAGGGIGDIQIYNPGRVTGAVGSETIPPGPDFSCEAQRGVITNPNLGRITSRDQELAGPDTTPGGSIPNAYVPCFYQAPVDGIYEVIFHGPRGGNSDFQIGPTGEIDLSSPDNFNGQQATSVAAWDVTVRDSLNSTTNITGRLFARYLALFAGGNSRLISSTLFILSTDGYIYRTDLAGFDPNGFIVYANDVGFYDSDGVTPLYYDAFDGNNNQLTNLQGGVTLAPPTHFIFFEQPSAEAIAANGVPSSPPDPQLNSITFSGNLGNNDTFIQAGGTFTYSSNISGTYELIISRDGVNFDPTDPLNRVLRGRRAPGTQTITWDGLDNAGNAFPVGLGYPVRLTVRAGEYHFPMLDVENSLNGGPQYTLLNPPGGTCPSFNGQPPNCNIAFYDDRGYTTANGTDVGTPGTILPGNNPPAQPRSDPLSGFDTTTAQRAFGAGGNDGFGDKKGLDLWTYFPSDPRNTSINIYALNLIIGKTDGGVVPTPGGVIAYTRAYTNTGPIDATGVVITETVPPNTTFNPAASSPGWNFTSVTAGSVVTRSVGTVPGNGVANPAVTFVVTVSNSLPAGVTQIANTATIGDDGANGPEPQSDNISTASTSLDVPLPSPPDSSGGDGGGGGDDDDDDDVIAPPPPPTPQPTAAPQPAPTLPVLLLPETGLREARVESGLFDGAFISITFLVVGTAIFLYVRKKLK